MKEYYDRRAPEYDDAYLGRGVWSHDEAPGLRDEIPKIQRFVASLPRSRTLDVACGTGFLTRFLSGGSVGLDQSFRMLEQARARAAAASYVQGDATQLPFLGGSFERIFSSHFYGRLELADRLNFLAEARRVAPELILVDNPFQEGLPEERSEERALVDGTSFRIYKRYFRPEALIEEIGGGDVVFSSTWFLAVRRRWDE